MQPPPSLHEVFDAVLDGVIALCPEGKIVWINEQACQMLDTSRESGLHRSLADLVGKAHPILDLVAAVQRNHRPTVEGEIPLDRPFQTARVVDVSVSPLLSHPPDARGVVLILRDRTAFADLHDEAAQRERLASYGQIAAGIAHEVKNPLGGIRGAAELLQLRIEDERGRKTAQLIVREVDRISGLVDELMVFARGEGLEARQVNLHRLLDEVIELVQAEPTAQNIRFEKVYDPSIPEFPADPDRLKQVFLNLAQNGVQAMEEKEGGTLTVSTGMALENRLKGKDGRQQPTVVICFEDEGPGISAAIKDQLSTPFFTTKVGGTGLGLSVARHWVSRHGGRLRIDVSHETGGRVRVKLPLIPQAADPTKGETSP
jgi:two-component system, NtrC family, nitrogen regulation sensor histidine kinase GlnL